MSFSVFIVALPRGYYPTHMTFSTKEQAQKLCDNFKSSASGSGISYKEITVFEDEDIKIKIVDC